MRRGKQGQIYKELEDLQELDFQADYAEMPEHTHDSYYDMNTEIAVVDRVNSLIHASNSWSGSL